jgi:CheY-like chemotaxis protein
MNEKKILVIEDDELNMKLVRTLLALGGYQAIEAWDAEEGIAKAHADPPDLILMDIQLPGMDGLSATQIIKKDEALKAIPIIALTAFAMQGDDRKAIDLGCNGYITKPIDTRKFLLQIEEFMKVRISGSAK